MNTEWIRMDREEEAERGCLLAGELFLKGEVVAFPTETVYGLGGWIGSEEGLRKIFEAKGRPSDNPLIVHIAPEGELSGIAREVSPQAQALMDRFWPGPMTLILKKAPGVSMRVTAGLDTVAVRMPSHPAAIAMLRSCGLPIAAPSANTSGRPSPTCAAHVWDDLHGKIPLLLDGGACEIGLESTIIDTTVSPMMILRPGGISLEMVREVIPDAQMDPGLKVGANVTPKAPGMKYRHYAPKAQMYMAFGSPDEQRKKIEAALEKAAGKNRGILAVSEHAASYAAETVLELGRREDPEALAAHLFACLREFDDKQCDILFAETIGLEGIGAAFMNRLRKACGGRLIEEYLKETDR